MKRSLRMKLLPLALCVAAGAAALHARADDIDIFTGASAGKSAHPRILIVLDNTSNWSRQSQQWPDGSSQGQSEANAIKKVIQTLDENIEVGLMEFVTGGTANDEGGFIRSAIRPMDATNKDLFTKQLEIINANITDPDEKRNSNTRYGWLMNDVYNYYTGGFSVSPNGVLASKADTDGYTSAFTQFKAPITSADICAKAFVIFIGNPNSRGPREDVQANTDALTALGANVDATGNPIAYSQLGLANFTVHNVTTSKTISNTGACYASAADAAVELPNFTAACSTYTEGCAIGAASAVTTPLACPTGTKAYTVIQSVYTPASTSTAPGTPVPGTTSSSTADSTGYYGAATEVPSTDHGTLTCPSTKTVTDPATGNTATTTYSCTYSVGAAVGNATTTTYPSSGTVYTSKAGNTGGAGCYKGVGTGAGEWNAATTTDFGTLVCPANSSCTYSGVSSSQASGCTGSGNRLVAVTMTATSKRHYTITQTVQPTTTNTIVTTTPASTVKTTLGYTAACYASPPSSTSDFSGSCNTGNSNITCTYNNTPTSDTYASCPAGTNVYSVVATDIRLTDAPDGTETIDTAVYNADEWARFMHDKGIPVTGTTTRPPISTYTIDVYNAQPNNVHSALMMSMAKAGGGRYFAAKNEQAIVDALKEIVVEIQAVNTTFASTSLPVNATNRSQNANQVFIGMFRPDADAKPRWFGNLKRYQLISTGAGIELGDIEGNVAVNSLTGFVTPCAQSYWTMDSGTYWSGLGVNPDPASGCTKGSAVSPTNPTGARVAVDKYSDAPDGPQVEKGAAAEVLRFGNVGRGSTASLGVNRNMLTLVGSSLVAFASGTSGLSTDLSKYIKGYDMNNERVLATADQTVTRPSIHGDVIHSRPLPVNYGDAGITVFYGSNDGTYRGVNADTGVERWSFVAPEFFSRLSRLQDNSPLVSYPTIDKTILPTPTPKDYFFDGSTGIYQNTDSSKVYIYPSMRRGGRTVYGLDVSNPDSPRYLWKTGCPNLTDDSGCVSGMEGMGQSWSTPSVAFLKGYPDKPVIIMGGGYDSCEDEDSKTPSCSGKKGGHVYVLDATTGERLQTFDTERAVPADVALIDIDNDGMPDYAFAADTGGNIYRIDFVKSYGSRTAAAQGDWTIRKVAYTAGAGRKFLFAPALLFSAGKVYVAIGSGDREHPLQAQYPYLNVLNRFYVYKDDLSAASTTPAYDLDSMENYTATTDCKGTPILPASDLKGWFMDLNQYGKGEQVVTTALIVGGMVTFSTNRPVPPDAGSCKTTLGEARGYWVNLFNGSGAIGVAGSCGGTRSSIFVGGGLTPSPVMASSVPIGTEMVSVVIGAAQKGSGVSVAIAPQRVRPTSQPTRKRSYTYVNGN